MLSERVVSALWDVLRHAPFELTVDAIRGGLLYDVLVAISGISNHPLGTKFNPERATANEMCVFFPNPHPPSLSMVRRSLRTALVYLVHHFLYSSSGHEEYKIGIQGVTMLHSFLLCFQPAPETYPDDHTFLNAYPRSHTGFRRKDYLDYYLRDDNSESWLAQVVNHELLRILECEYTGESVLRIPLPLIVRRMPSLPAANVSSCAICHTIVAPDDGVVADCCAVFHCTCLVTALSGFDQSEEHRTDPHPMYNSAEGLVRKCPHCNVDLLMTVLETIDRFEGHGKGNNFSDVPATPVTTDEA
jgi:hypothetical protein